MELREVVRHYTMVGHGVRLDGLGIYSPGVELDGSIIMHHRTDRYLIKELNKEGAFRGTIVNRENIGKTSVDLLELWNEVHPEDPVSN